ncbi:hypothetical protein DYB30_000358 [Aphanomyces astaci]|uniref:Uncharacterized protein n=2 Tax=Aphanomyces astaci TaxID=112090 RepID=A0A397ECM3_APHAT|nr:hypothetical protein DYB34_000585 [Aphanomyces astaci]RHY76315.1 hypothetical protein DYB30_000358 [Aphanomyces astaci]
MELAQFPVNNQHHTLVSILVAASVLTRSSMILCRSTAAASGLFAKKCAEKEYLALVHGTMPFTPPRGHKCCTLSRVPDFIHDKDHPKVILQHQHKFTKQFKGTCPSMIVQSLL